MTDVNAFHIGPQKAATTWLYECFEEHPQITCANTNNLHYFDMYYDLWDRQEYHEQFPSVHDKYVTVDFTQSYIRSEAVPERIHNYNPDARIMLCLRNPVERAFSHYWHVKKKNKINYAFDEVLENYDLYASWIEPGFYTRHLQRYLEYFSRDQILVQKFSDLNDDPEAYLNQSLSFLGVNTDVHPSVLDEVVNEAGPKGKIPHLLLHKANKFCAQIMPAVWKKYNITSRIEQLTKNEYEQGITEQLKQTLHEIYAPEIERTEQLLDINLDEWKS